MAKKLLKQHPELPDLLANWARHLSLLNVKINLESFPPALGGPELYSEFAQQWANAIQYIPKKFRKAVFHKTYLDANQNLPKKVDSHSLSGRHEAIRIARDRDLPKLEEGIKEIFNMPENMRTSAVCLIALQQGFHIGSLIPDEVLTSEFVREALEPQYFSMFGPDINRHDHFQYLVSALCTRASLAKRKIDFQSIIAEMGWGLDTAGRFRPLRNRDSVTPHPASNYTPPPVP